MPNESALAEWLLSAIAAACRCDRAALCPRTSLAEIAMDSLTLVSIVAQAEAIHGVQVPVDDLNEMFQAARIGDLLTLLARAGCC